MSNNKILSKKAKLSIGLKEFAWFKDIVNPANCELIQLRLIFYKSFKELHDLTREDMLNIYTGKVFS